MFYNSTMNVPLVDALKKEAQSELGFFNGHSAEDAQSKIEEAASKLHVRFDDATYTIIGSLLCGGVTDLGELSYVVTPTDTVNPYFGPVIFDVNHPDPRHIPFYDIHGRYLTNTGVLAAHILSYTQNNPGNFHTPNAIALQADRDVELVIRGAHALTGQPSLSTLLSIDQIGRQSLFVSHKGPSEIWTPLAEHEVSVGDHIRIIYTDKPTAPAHIYIDGILTATLNPSESRLLDELIANQGATYTADQLQKIIFDLYQSSDNSTEQIMRRSIRKIVSVPRLSELVHVSDSQDRAFTFDDDTAIALVPDQDQLAANYVWRMHYLASLLSEINSAKQPATYAFSVPPVHRQKDQLSRYRSIALHPKVEPLHSPTDIERVKKFINELIRSADSDTIHLDNAALAVHAYRTLPGLKSVISKYIRTLNKDREKPITITFDECPSRTIQREQYFASKTARPPRQPKKENTKPTHKRHSKQPDKKIVISPLTKRNLEILKRCQRERDLQAANREQQLAAQEAARLLAEERRQKRNKLPTPDQTPVGVFATLLEEASKHEDPLIRLTTVRIAWLTAEFGTTDRALDAGSIYARLIFSPTECWRPTSVDDISGDLRRIYSFLRACPQLKSSEQIPRIFRKGVFGAARVY